MSTQTLSRPVYLTPPQIAASRGIAPAKVLQWIRSGELRAVNMATRPGARPMWRIHEADLAAFEAARAATPPPAVTRARRPKPADIIEFF